MEVNNNRHNILSSNISPNPLSVKYWADLNADPTGGVIKRWDGKQWSMVNAPEATDPTLESWYKDIISKMADLEARVKSLEKDMPAVKTSINDLSERVGVLEQTA